LVRTPLAFVQRLAALAWPLRRQQPMTASRLSILAVACPGLDRQRVQPVAHKARAGPPSADTKAAEAQATSVAGRGVTIGSICVDRVAADWPYSDP
ncbi:MAG: hypothetical protein ACRC2B_07045, partial [Rubrivivax sp.]